MEIVISALTVIVNVFMTLPSRTLAASDSKKAEIGRRFAQFVQILDGVISRAYFLLSRLEHLIQVRGTDQYDKERRQLEALIENQIQDLSRLDTLLEQDITSSNLLDDIVGFNKDEFFREPTRIQTVLSIYQPHLGTSLQSVIGFKRYTLSTFARIFANNKDLNEESFVIRELVYVDPFLMNDSTFASVLKHGAHDEAVTNQLVRMDRLRFQNLDLTKQAERELYFTRARTRLDELSNARDQLAELIRQYYEPHLLA